jgi:hypothetical protein
MADWLLTIVYFSCRCKAKAGKFYVNLVTDFVDYVPVYLLCEKTSKPWISSGPGTMAMANVTLHCGGGNKNESTL